MKKKSLFDLTELVDRRVPVAITAVFLLQAGTAVWWAASKDTEDRFTAARVDVLESRSDQAAAAQTQMLERLARIEERLKAQSDALERIEQHIEGQHP